MTLAEHLDRCLTQGPLSADRLLRTLRGVTDTDALLQAATFRPDAYVRMPLHHTRRYEARMLCWLPGQSSALHGHGEAACAYIVLRGEATETDLHGQQTRLRPGEGATTAPGRIHQMANLGPGPLVTLHLYAPALPVDQPSTSAGRQVVIVGGGFCGTALAIHLLRSGDPDLRITLVERTARVARGQAYSPADPTHRLNVPAARMSLDPADPDDFLHWAGARLGTLSPHALLPRRLYGEYLVDRLADAVLHQPGRLRLARARVLDVERAGNRWRALLDDGRTLPADELVLALGNGPAPMPPGLLGVAHDRRLHRDATTPAAVAPDPAARVLVVGTGLTSLDVLHTLRARGHHGAVVAVSRHGRWPQPHLPEVVWQGPLPSLDAPPPSRADAIAGWVRRQVAQAREHGVPWQAAIDAVRLRLPSMWAALSEAERSALLRHHRPAWEVVRHRAPADAHAQRLDAEHDGALRTVAATLIDASAHDDGITVTWRGQDGRERATFDHVVLATGALSPVHDPDDPLGAALRHRGLVRPDSFGLGLHTDQDGAVLGADPADGLWALGSLRRPDALESTSVPDLAAQVAALATRLIHRSQRHIERQGTRQAAPTAAAS